MTIFAADDEALALEMLTQAIQAAQPGAAVHAFRKVSELLAFAEDTPCDVAFLDIDMRGASGLDIALKLKSCWPRVNIVFVTGYAEHMASAFSMHASGYLLKPVTAAMVERELKNLRFPVAADVPHVFIKTFGNFDVFVERQPLLFPRAKAKELLAYLVDRQGATATAAEIAAVLWEDKPYDRSLQKQTQNVIGFMSGTLKEAGIQDILVKGWNQLAVDAGKFACDYYQLLRGDVRAVNAYCGEYMTNYSWAEMTTGVLNAKALESPRKGNSGFKSSRQ